MRISHPRHHFPLDTTVIAMSCDYPTSLMGKEGSFYKNSLTDKLSGIHIFHKVKQVARRPPIASLHEIQSGSKAEQNKDKARNYQSIQFNDQIISTPYKRRALQGCLGGSLGWLSIQLLILAQVMVSQLVRSSPTSGSVPTTQSLLKILSLSAHLPLIGTLSLSK